MRANTKEHQTVCENDAFHFRLERGMLSGKQVPSGEILFSCQDVMSTGFNRF